MVALNIFPTKLLDAVITTKTATPDRPADFTGGSVDIRTKAFPEQRVVLTLSFSGTYNSLSTTESLPLPGLSGSAWLGTPDASRSLPSVPLPATDAVADAPETIRFFQGVRNVYTPATLNAPPNFTLAATYGDQLSSGVLGWIVAANYSTGYDAQANRLFRFVRTPSLENEPDGAAGATFQEASSSVDVSLVANLSARVGSNSILGFRNLFTQSGTDRVYDSDGYNVENANYGYRTYQGALHQPVPAAKPAQRRPPPHVLQGEPTGMASHVCPGGGRPTGQPVRAVSLRPESGRIPARRCSQPRSTGRTHGSRPISMIGS